MDAAHEQGGAMRATGPGLAAIIIIVLASTACDDTQRDCSYVLEPCDSAGTLRCNEGGTAVEMCQYNIEGCALWETRTVCAENQICDDSSTIECVCDDECDAVDDTRCDGDVVQLCTDDGSGCLLWSDQEDCSDAGDTCVVQEGEAQCGACSDECDAEGDTQCNGEVIETCTTGDGDCLEWVGGVDCADSDPSQFCDDTGAMAVCVDECVDRCDEVDATQCDGDVVEICAEAESGCLDWEVAVDCADEDPPESCEETDDGAVCAPGCLDECDADGDMQCNGEVIETCEPGGDGCLDWSSGTDCAALSPPQYCDDSGAEPVCALSCSDRCDTLDATRCDGYVIESCEVAASGCLDWVDGTDCSVTADYCDDSSGDALCMTCPAGCAVSGDTRCAGVVIETCTTDIHGCNSWVAGTDCSVTADYCDDSGATAVCLDCPVLCPADGDTRCVGNDLETCLPDGDGCLDWSSPVDCGATDRYCDDIGAGATCIACGSECAVPATTCVGDVVETCTADAHGCRYWVAGDDCSAEVPPAYCDVGGGSAACVAISAGDACAVTAVVTPPYMVAGADFAAAYTNRHSLAGAGCPAGGASSEAVFEVALAAGETLVARELGGLNALISLQTTCGDTGACLLTEDDPEELRYTAAAAETVYVIVEAAAAVPAPADFDIRLDLAGGEDCGNMVDDDIDGATDCDDTDCICHGLCGPCETECDDGLDNDGDTHVDCADFDCSIATPCLPYRGIYEHFDHATTDRSDLEGTMLTFTPSATEYHGYTWSVTTGVFDFAVVPGTGTPSMVLPLSDDDSDEHLFTTFPGFPLYGTTYSSVWVSSNGYVTFGTAETDYTPTEEEFFAMPHVAAFYRDLNPYHAGSVTVDEFTDRLVVTFEDVPRYSGRLPNNFQIILGSDGSVDLVYVTLDGDTGMVGISSDVGVLPYPGETDFFAVSGLEVCGDAVDNDGDGDPDCDDSECFGVAPCLSELNCRDGLDNDGDTFVDCDDVADCAADTTCVPETECSDSRDNDLDSATDCADSDCFGVGPSCTTETLCTDGEDNDLDGNVDCDDSDCAPTSPCIPYVGIYEAFGTGDAFDLEGYSVAFTPDAGEPNGFTWVATGGVTDFIVTPGTGTVTTPLAFATSTYERVLFDATLMATFPFYTYTENDMYVVTNGMVHFNAADAGFGMTEAEIFRYRSVMPLRHDLDPGAGGTVTVDEFTDRVAITWDAVPRTGTADLCSFQIILAADGTITLAYVAVPIGAAAAAAGVINGRYSGTTYPAESNFLP